MAKSAKPSETKFSPNNCNQELNILILGETGVGKSTWINAFQNYLVYNSFEEADKNKLLNSIPTSFTVTNDQHETITIQTGKDENENFATGMSSTQGARIHKFRLNQTIIRLIDTPGVADVRGIEQDKVNMKNILDTIGNLEALHGICILLKSNSDKLTTQFKFCVKELLTNLHRGASNNIAFCFTYSRGTQYRPADAMSALNVLLSENENINFKRSRDTIYCFDNEAIRYLAASKNNPPFHFTERERNDFKHSWDHSAEETRRLLRHFQELQPHPVRDTISLHNARNVVLKLTKPIAEVTKKIETNKLRVKEERQQIEKASPNINELRNHVKVRRLEIKSRKLDYSKLVCSHLECRRNDFGSKSRYGICHNWYNVKGIRADIVGVYREDVDGERRDWEHWTGFSDEGICIHCNHKFHHHHIIFYESSEVDIVNDDNEIKRVLAETSNGEEAKRQMVSAKLNLLKEFEKELKQICEASVRFAHFTRVNSMLPYNDGMEDYLKLSIEEEKSNTGIGSSTYKMLVERLEEYRREKEILNEEMKKGSSQERSLSPEEILVTVNQLKNLKHSGKNLTDALDCIIETENAVNKSITFEQEPIVQITQPQVIQAMQNPGVIGRESKGESSQSGIEVKVKPNEGKRLKEVKAERISSAPEAENNVSKLKALFENMGKTKTSQGKVQRRHTHK